MKETEYLYDCDPEEFADLPYREALRFKLERAKTLSVRLDAQIRQAKDWTDAFPLRARYHHVRGAILHNEALIEELEGGVM